MVMGQRTQQETNTFFVMDSSELKSKPAKNNQLCLSEKDSFLDKLAKEQ